MQHDTGTWKRVAAANCASDARPPQIKDHSRIHVIQSRVAGAIVIRRIDVAVPTTFLLLLSVIALIVGLFVLR